MSALLEEAMRQVDVAVERTLAAIQAEAYARGELVSLKLLSLAELDPSIVSYTIETGWEYDDEGGYFHTVSLWPQRQSDVEREGVAPELEDQVSDELLDVNHWLDEASVALFGGDEAVITIAQLRERAEVIS